MLDSFQEFYRLSEAQAQEAILKYRERFATVGWLENEVYPGMPELLDRLCQAGKTMMVATSKPEVFARKILDHFQLAAYFSFVGGATLDGVRSTKEEVIDYVLKTNEVVSLSEVIMVGDRKFDILGAKHAGVSSVGCVYGYGSREELETAGADYVVDSIGELQNLLLP